MNQRSGPIQDYLRQLDQQAQACIAHLGRLSPNDQKAPQQLRDGLLRLRDLRTRYAHIQELRLNILRRAQALRSV